MDPFFDVILCMIQLTYIWHDGFLLETDSCDIVFDFWKDPMSADQGDPEFLSRADRDKPLYVLVSHHHKDHFSRSIFQWASHRRNIHYVVSKDVYRHSRHVFSPDSLYSGQKIPPGKFSVLKEGDVFNDEIISVRAFGSTDTGNSYFIETCGLKIFHAGDLNAWVWKDESTQEEVDEALRAYTNILDSIGTITDGFDLAMFPVDSRIGRDYWEGASIFVRRFKIGRFFPMHFELGENEDERTKRRLDASDFKLYANPERGEYIALQQPYARYFTGNL